VDTWYSGWAPEWLKPLLRPFTPDTLSSEALVAQLNEALQLPGVTNAWTMPVKGRIDMLTTGIRTPIGVKVTGADLKVIEDVGTQLEAVLSQVPGTRSVFAERTSGGYFLDIDWKREALARHGLSIDEAQAVVQSAIGGENVTLTVEGRERYPVNVRYMRDFRSDVGALGRVLVPASAERQIPLAELATVKAVSGPSMIRNEDGLLTGYVYVDVAGRDPESYVREAAERVREQVKLAPGYGIFWSGQFEAMERVERRLEVVLPLTALLIFLLLYTSTRSLPKTLIVALAVPFSAIGAVWFLYLLGYNMSVGVWVGLIALLGIDAATGVYMLLYLDLSYQQAREEGRLRSFADLREAVMHGAVKRIRPKFMTVCTTLIGLLPIMWASGTGADVMKRMAAPIIGGILTSFLLELLIYPGIYETWKWHSELRRELKQTS
jgi:copper/silver efflux system protein